MVAPDVSPSMKHALGLVLAASLAPSAHALDGTWEMQRDASRPAQVQLELSRGRSHQSGTLVPRDAFSGLTPEQIDAAVDTPVAFALRRDPGELAFQGRFRAGRGTGTFTFAPRPAFLDDLRALGIETGRKGEEDLFGLATLGLDVVFVKSLLAEGYRLSLDDYVPMRIFDVSPAFIGEMRSLGLGRLSHQDLVAFRIHGVTPQFAAQMRRLGFPDLSRDDLLAFRIHGVTGEFILDLRDLGYADVTADDLVAARIHGVTPEFIREVAHAGYKGLPFADLIDLRIRGVRPQELRRTRID